MKNKQKTQYERICKIGNGGFGIVEEVKGSQGQRFARKTFVAPQNDSQAKMKLKKRFSREVKTQLEIGGDEIFPILDYDLNCEDPWFVMPLAQATYREQIKNDQFEGNVTVSALGDILNALQKMHDLGFVHRDLNPNNVLLHDGKWKLSDLGAILPPNGGTIVLTEDTAIFTESYCAPEQRKNFHSAEPTADIYSFGCILHDLFGKGQRTPYAQHTAEGDIGVIIERCTHLNPAKRPTLSRLRSLLFEALRDEEIVSRRLDEKSEEWLERLEDLKRWPEEMVEDFGRFFLSLDTEERANGRDEKYLQSETTPFLTRLSIKTIKRLSKAGKGVTNAVLEKYCEWVDSTDFDFDFSDNVCLRLRSIIEHGGPTQAAAAFLALVRLAHGHNRYFVMRTVVALSRNEQLDSNLVRRIAMELKIEGREHEFKGCVRTLKVAPESLDGPLQGLFT